MSETCLNEIFLIHTKMFIDYFQYKSNLFKNGILVTRASHCLFEKPLIDSRHRQTFS